MAGGGIQGYVSVPSGGGLGISTRSLGGLNAGHPYSVSLVASGGTAPYVWTVVGGSLPAGLDLASSAGTIEGVPQAPGAWAFTGST